MKALILAYDGFEDIELVATADIVRRGKILCNVASMTGKETLSASNGTKLLADFVLEKNPDCDKLAEEYDCIILPGGGPNAFALRDDERCMKLLKTFAGKNKKVAAICAAPIALERAGLLEGKKATSYTDMIDKTRCTYMAGAKAVVDGNIITSCGPAGAYEFGYAIVTELAGKSVSDKLKKDMLY